MIALNIPEKTARNLLEYINEFLDNACSQKFIREAEEDKNRIKSAIGRAMGRPKSMLADFRLKDMVKKLT
jgi:hypothetical protein